MGKKEIIVICRSGGEFKTNKDDGSLSYNGGEAYAIDVDQKTKLTDFKRELADTFECNVNDLLIKYFLPGNKTTLITVSKDKDFKRMVNFYSDFDNVDVFVSTDGPAARNGSNQLATRYLLTFRSYLFMMSYFFSIKFPSANNCMIPCLYAIVVIHCM